MPRNPPGKETSKRVGSAAGRLQALMRKHRHGRFVFLHSDGVIHVQEDVHLDVRACAGSAHVQRQLPKNPRRGKGKGKARR